MSTHNLCLGAKIRKKVYPCVPQFYKIKVGYKGVFISLTCFSDEQPVKFLFHNSFYSLSGLKKSQ